jgi:hypothetical protein
VHPANAATHRTVAIRMLQTDFCFDYTSITRSHPTDRSKACSADCGLEPDLRDGDRVKGPAVWRVVAFRIPLPAPTDALISVAIATLIRLIRRSTQDPNPP